MQVIMQNPFFGAFDYFYSPQMQDLKQGRNGGIIDLVNSYMAIGLTSGLVGLSLFSGFFITIAVGIFKGIRNLSDKHNELHSLGQGLLCTLLGIMLIIFTASSIGLIPVIYWSVAGLGVAYAKIVMIKINSKQSQNNNNFEIRKKSNFRTPMRSPT